MEFMGTAWALLPPVVAIILALITKETYTSLLIGIIVGAFLLAGFDPVAAINNIICGTVVNVSGKDASVGIVHAISDPWNAGIFVFLIMLGVMVALVNTAGGSAAFGTWAAKHIKTRVGTQIATFVLGVLIFIDDYFNCLTVGAVMRPVADSHKLSRAKLSYIIDATAAPICMIAPISSWAAAVSATASDLGGGVHGIDLFIQSIPYNFYSLLTIIFVISICILGFDYGPMAKEELNAIKTGDLGSLGNEEPINNPKASLWDMLIPIVLLIVCCVVGMMYVGGFWNPDTLTSEAEHTYHNFPLAFGNTDASVALPWGGLIALVVSFLYLLIRRIVSFEKAAECIVTGFKAMVPSLLILTFALTLKLATTALGADVFVASMMEGAAEGLYMMLPAIVFLVALGLAFATGTSWGTFGILIPIVLPIFPVGSQLLTIGISACLAGAVCGDHISPISDTTIMASAGANCNHVKHISTQLPYALTVAAVSFVCFILAGFIQNWMICLPIGIVLIIGILFILRQTIGQKANKIIQQ